MAGVRIGTCSWSERTMVRAWYPSGVSTAEQRLRYYAKHFDTVEVDSVFYGLPTPRMTELWSERTSDEFVFHVKAYGLMTGHTVAAGSLLPEHRELPHKVTARGRVYEPSPELVDACFASFREVVSVLQRVDKLGAILLQYSSRFTAADAVEARANMAVIERARERLDGMRVAVEFRHPSWVEEGRLPQTVRFLEAVDASYVSVDNPQFPGSTTMPPLALATAGRGYVRLHGRNAETFFARTATAADRFDYLYSEAELREWEPRIRELDRHADEVYVLFNNCRNDFAPRNARMMGEILADVVRRHEGGSLPGQATGPGASGEQVSLDLGV